MNLKVETFHSSDPRWQECCAIRFTVFVDEQRVPPEEEIDRIDEVALHYLLRSPDGQPLATARLFTDNEAEKVGRIGRMAVLKEARGTGAGMALMMAMLKESAQRGYTRVILDAQVQAIGFYERAGFRVCGLEHDDCGIPHKMMEITDAELHRIVADRA